jgi:hypothetical protein
MAAEGKDPLAWVGMLRTTNHGVERVLNTDRKETHWGKRKLKRDQRKRPPTEAALEASRGLNQGFGWTTLKDSS